MQGAYVVWLPLEIAIIHRRTAGTGRQSLLTRRAAAVLVGALVDATSMNVLLALPAVTVTLCLFAIWFGVEDVRARRPAASTGPGLRSSPPPSAWSWPGWSSSASTDPAASRCGC